MLLSLMTMALLLLALHLPVFLFLWARWRQVLPVHRLVLGAVLGTAAQVVLTAYVLGLVRAFTPPLWGGLNLLLAGLITFLAWRRGLAWPELRGALSERLSLLRSLPRRPALLLVLLISAAVLALLIAKAWLYPPYGYDELAAHLCTSRLMLQDHGPPLQVAPRPRASFSPRVPHLFFAAALARPRGYEWVNGASIYFLLLALLAQYALSRRMGVRRSRALFVAPAVLCCPVLLQQATTAYIDLPAAAFLAAGLAFFPWRRESALVDVAFAGLGLGLALGSKESMLIAAPLFALAVCLEAWCLRPAPRRFGLLAPVVLLFVGVMLLGGYTYLANFIQHGNPVWANRVKVLGLIFPGLDMSVGKGGVFLNHPLSDAYRNASPFVQMWMSWREEALLLVPFVYQADTTLGGFGPLWYVLFLPALAFSLMLHRRRAWFLVVGAMAAFLISFPDLRCLTRYVAPIFFLGPVAYALVGGSLSRAGDVIWKGLFVGLLGLALAMNISFQQDDRGALAGWYLRTSISERTPEPSPASQFLKDIPRAHQQIAAGQEGYLKAYCLWNREGTDEVRWMLKPGWPAVAGSLGYPETMAPEDLQQALTEAKSDFAAFEPEVTAPAQAGYALVIPSSPGREAFMLGASPVSVWMRVPSAP